MVDQTNNSDNPQNDVPDGFKRCSRCGRIKPLPQFYKHKTAIDGIRDRCHDCRRRPAQIQLQDWSCVTKQCVRCKRTLKITSFPTLTSQRHRFSAYCEDCHIELIHLQGIPKDRSEKGFIEWERERNRRWREQNREKARLKDRRWIQKNRDKKRANFHRYRARKRQLSNVSISNMETYLKDIQQGKCIYCQCDLAEYHVDHIIPLALADLLGDKHPGHVPSNLALACPHCNQSKGDSILEDWLQWKYPEQMDEILHRVDDHIAMMENWWRESNEAS